MKAPEGDFWDGDVIRVWAAGAWGSVAAVPVGGVKVKP